MVESNNSQVDVDGLLAEIRAEVQRRQPRVMDRAGVHASQTAPLQSSLLASIPETEAQIDRALATARQKNHVNDRIPKVFRPFFRNQGGFNAQLVEVIELQGRKISALHQELVHGRADIEKLYGHMGEQAAEFNEARQEWLARIAELHQTLAGNQSQIQRLRQELSLLAELRQGLTDSQSQILQLRKELAQHAVGLEEARQEPRAQLAELRQALADSQSQILQLRKELGQHAVGLEEARQEPRAQLAELRQALTDSQSQILQLRKESAERSIRQESDDALYLAFANRFRGSQTDIKNRLRVYLPYLAKANVGKMKRPILDLGCGRGEWLDLLGENGYVAHGVDSNTAMVSMSRERGLEVIQADAIEHLRSLPNQSHSVITAFHIIEHLSFARLVDLLRETYRVLTKGGLAILETPNPENIRVASETFFTDPTHVQPLPSSLAEFLMQHAGFANTQVIRLHKRCEPDYTGQKYVDELIWRLTMEQDYAIIGSK